VREKNAGPKNTPFLEKTKQTTMMRLISFSSYSLMMVFQICELIPVYGFIASSSLLHQRHASVAAFIAGVAQQHPHKSEHSLKQNTVLPAVVVDSSEWYSPQQVPSPVRLSSSSSSQQQHQNSRKVLQTPLTTMEDYAAFLASAGENEMVLIKFHATWYVP
jgi:hypothetical protein